MCSVSAYFVLFLIFIFFSFYLWFIGSSFYLFLCSFLNTRRMRSVYECVSLFVCLVCCFFLSSFQLNLWYYIRWGILFDFGKQTCMESGNGNGCGDSSHEEVRIMRNRTKNIVYMHGHWHTCVFIFSFLVCDNDDKFLSLLELYKIYILTFYTYICTVCIGILLFVIQSLSLSIALVPSSFAFMHNSFRFFSRLNHISLLNSSCIAAWLDMS